VKERATKTFIREGEWVESSIRDHGGQRMLQGRWREDRPLQVATWGMYRCKLGGIFRETNEKVMKNGIRERKLRERKVRLRIETKSKGVEELGTSHQNSNQLKEKLTRLFKSVFNPGRKENRIFNRN